MGNFYPDIMKISKSDPQANLRPKSNGISNFRSAKICGKMFDWCLMASFTDTNKGVCFNVKVVPGSSRTQLAGTIGDRIKIKIAAAPEKGKANDCLIDYLAALLNVKKNAVRIASGHTSPVKQICIEGRSSAQIEELLASASQEKKV